MSAGSATTVIEPKAPGIRTALLDVWRARELVLMLAMRDVRIRYKQTVFGAAWAVLQPLTLMAIFSLFLGRLVPIPGDGGPYALFVLSGLVPWTLLATALTSSSNSLVNNAPLVSKVYFPRLALPIASAGAHVVDAVVSAVLLVVLTAFWIGLPGLEVALLLAAITLALFVAVGVGTGLAALNVRYRDVRHAVPFLLQAWFFASPIAYPSSLLPDGVRPLALLNPVSGVVSLARAAVLGTPVSLAEVGTGVVVAVGLAGAGTWYFDRARRSFADEL